MDKSELKSYRALSDELAQLKRAMASSGANKLAEHYQYVLSAKETQQLKIEQAIEALSDSRERLIMRERYIFARSWPAIATTLRAKGISEREMYRLHSEALKKMKEI